MELSLSQLSLLIELTEKEILRLKEVIDNPSSTNSEVDDCGELSMQYLSLEVALSEAYKSKWTEDSGEPRYEDLGE